MASLEIITFRAMSETTLPLSGSIFTKRLYNWLDTASMVVPEVTNCGLNVSGEPSLQYNKVCEASCDSSSLPQFANSMTEMAIAAIFEQNLVVLNTFETLNCRRFYRASCISLDNHVIGGT